VPGAQVVDEDESAEMALGTPLPALSGTWLTPDGKAPEMNNKVVLVDIWSTFCRPCIASIPSNNKLFAEYAPKGFVFAGVAPETKLMLEDFMKKVEIQYPVLATTEAAIKPFSIHYFPSTFLFDRKGKLVWKGNLLERDGKLEESFAKALTAALDAAPQVSSSDSPAAATKTEQAAGTAAPKPTSP
jgi:thiol-disulfide isomerase/thioredoxin